MLWRLCLSDRIFLNRKKKKKTTTTTTNVKSVVIVHSSRVCVVEVMRECGNVVFFSLFSVYAVEEGTHHTAFNQIPSHYVKYNTMHAAS